METETEKKQFSIRPTGEVHERLTEAAAWQGQTLHAFVLGAAVREADGVLESRDKIRLTEGDAAMVLELIDAAAGPNEAMQEAMRLHKETFGAKNL
jgi:uncharacterized protein (DUF1778 family)